MSHADFNLGVVWGLGALGIGVADRECALALGGALWSLDDSHRAVIHPRSCLGLPTNCFCFKLLIEMPF